MITDFKLLYEDPEYDHTSNPERRSVGELTPIWTAWRVLPTGDEKALRFRERGIAILLKDAAHVGVVEIESPSKAYILDESGSTIRTITTGKRDEIFF
jgi:hypothetical protein